MGRQTDINEPAAEGAATAVRMAQLDIRLFGGFRVTVEGHAIPADAWRLRKAAALVKLLALTPGHRLHRDQILDQLWAESDPASAANNLHYTLHVARRLLDPDRRFHPLPLRDDYLLLDGVVTVDLENFESAAAGARGSGDLNAYRDALVRYTGELLPEDRYEDWTVAPREQAETTHLTLRRELAALLEAQGEVVEAIEQLRSVLRADPTLEDAHMGLMRLYAASGQRQQALRQYDELVRVLEEELGVEPDSQAQQLVEQIRTRGLPDAGSRTRSTSPPLSPAASFPAIPRNNLPATITSFVGREAEKAEVLRLLRENRLVTVLGPGGAGKTRLSLEIARHLVVTASEAYPHGVWLVELGPLRDPDLLPETIADILGIPDNLNQSPQETLICALQRQRLLLLLDNCEHLIDAVAPLVQVLLQSCPQLHILATSREAMHVPGEVTGVLPPLTLPDATHAFHQADAVQLFKVRARDRQPHFALTETNAPTISAICRQVDGMPLAIELAAARVGMLPLEGIASRLADSIGFLTRGSRTAEPRQQTLKGALDWSYALLDGEECELFARLAVFAGGWTLEAAEALGGGAAVLDVLSRLVDKSLVVAEASGDGSIRYRFLEPIRQYAQQRLEETGWSAAIRLQHATYFETFAGEAQSQLKGPNQELWLHYLEQEHDNLRAALRWTVAKGDVAVGMRIAGHLTWFWYVHGHLREGQEWCELLAARGASAPPAERARVYHGLGSMTYPQRKYEQAAVAFETALELYREVDDEQQIANGLGNVALVAFEQGDFERAARLHEESLELWRKTGNERGISSALRNLGAVTNVLGRPDRAQMLFEEGLAIDRKREDTVAMAVALYNLAELANQMGNLERTEELAREALPLSVAVGLKEVLTSCLDRFGDVALAAAQPARAARLYGAADTVRASIGSPIQPREMPVYERRLNNIRAALGPSFDAAWSEGQDLTLEQAVEYALGGDGRQDGMRSESRIPGQHALSPRETEIASLIAEGWTNRQIAGKLGIAERTVDTHVSKILHKLDISSRTQIAVCVLDEKQVVGPVAGES
ncbi:MAG TPA: tetratricopeptide repeat protein [Chloroflexota bacterium]